MSSNTSAGGSSTTCMLGKSGRSLIFWGRVVYAHSTISSKLLGFVVSAMRPTYHQDKRRDVGTRRVSALRAITVARSPLHQESNAQKLPLRTFGMQESSKAVC